MLVKTPLVYKRSVVSFTCDRFGQIGASVIDHVKSVLNISQCLQHYYWGATNVERWWGRIWI